MSTHPTSKYYQDRILLEGPHTRRRELWLVLRALRDFIVGFRTLHFVGPCVTVFGSARFAEGHPYYELARDVGRGLSRLGFTVMTGGGPGIMEGANRGAQDVGGRSVGCSITLPSDEDPNPYLDEHVRCRYFFVRKVMLFKYSYAFVALPGGFGTMDEIFEALTLIQTDKILNFPVVLMGKNYWRPLRELLEGMVADGAVDAGDLNLWLMTDDLGDALAHIREHAIAKFGLRAGRLPRPSKWLREPARL